MGSQKMESGFTIVEIIVTIVVMTIFTALLFQTYITGTTQREAITRRAQADDIALTNLKKITTHASTLVSACSSANDLTATPAGSGSQVASVAYGTASDASHFAQESYGSLPTPHNQTLTVFYPRGCTLATVVEIVSTVTYGAETVTHASYIN